MSMSQEMQIPEAYQWKKRVLLLFSSHHSDKFQQQRDIFDDKRAGLEERDLVVFHINREIIEDSKGKKYGRNEAKKLRQQYQVADGGFLVVLIGKDGTKKLQQNEVLSTDKLFAVIDAMPMRKREMREAGEN